MKKIIWVTLIIFMMGCGYYFFYHQPKTLANCACEKMSKQAAILASLNSKKIPGMVWIPAGTFLMGANASDKEAKLDEKPQHKVTVHGFYMDETDITNEQFSAFVKKTKYVTTAEKPVNWELLRLQLPPDTPKPSADQLAPGSLVFSPPDHPVDLQNPALWWKWMNGADWRHPSGPFTKIFGKDHPVTQVSWFDANEYCQSLGKRLPTEAEWEWAARGGLKDKLYPWGDEDIDTGALKANTWQGNFPFQNTLRDHYYWTSPVKSFPSNGYGLYDMAGNVWQWTAELYDTNYYSQLEKSGIVNNPVAEKSYDPDEPNVKKYVLRGGSYLCNKSYCSGYRVSARMKTSPDTSLENVGFRCVKD